MAEMFERHPEAGRLALLRKRWPDQLVAELDGELDRICRKAMHLEQIHRYDSVEQFCDELTHWLERGYGSERRIPLAARLKRHMGSLTKRLRG